MFFKIVRFAQVWHIIRYQRFHRIFRPVGPKDGHRPERCRVVKRHSVVVLTGVFEMKKDRRFNLSVVSRYVKFLGLFSAAGFLIYKGEIYNDASGSVLPVMMCGVMALC